MIIKMLLISQNVDEEILNNYVFNFSNLENILFLQNVFNFKSKSKDEERFYEKSNAIFDILFNMTLVYNKS